MALTQEQLKAKFDELDKDKSGALKLKEALELTKVLGYEATKTEVFRTFKEMDKDGDGDGRISFEEFSAWYNKRTSMAGVNQNDKSSLSYGEILEAFRKIDTDFSGYLEFNEIVQLAKDLGENTNEEDMIKLFKEIDTNDDRKISFSEFLSWYRFGKDLPFAKAMKTHMSIMAGLGVANKHLRKFEDGNLEGDGR